MGRHVVEWGHHGQEGSLTDPATTEVIRGGLVHIAEEMGLALRRSAHSPNIKERLDMSCSVLDPEARLAAQADHIPVHLGSMGFAVRNGLAALESPLGEGDVLIFNDPYLSGTHLPDITVVAPVFHEGEMVSIVANKAHHADVGGPSPGSLSHTCSRLEDEGVVVPPSLLVRSGELDESLVSWFCDSTRTPIARRGDLGAQLAALHTGVRRIEDMVLEHGREALLGAMGDIMDASEARVRTALRGIPDGEYLAEGDLEIDATTIRLRLVIDGDRATFDFTGTSHQVDMAMNAPLGVTLSGVYFGLIAMTDHTIPMNEGCLRPVEVIVPRGTILNPLPPAAVAGGNVETSQRNADVVLHALSEAIPERAMADSQGTMNNVCIGGEHLGRRWTFYETIGGGSGAMRGKDGTDGIQVNMTNTMNTPIESMEAEFPVRFMSYRLRDDSGGPGRWRGGCGLERSWTLLSERATLSIMAERNASPPRGAAGGDDGTCSEFIISRHGTDIRLGGKTVFTMLRGDTLTIRTPGGGGFGDPMERDPGAIDEDVASGLVSRSSAKGIHGHDDLHDDHDPV